MHDERHYRICIDREDPSTVYIALKNKLMTCQAKEWSLEEAARLLTRFIESLDDDLACVKDYVEKVRQRLISKKDDTEFTRYHAFFLLSMCLSKPHQLAFDDHMKTLRDTRTASSLLEPFDKAMRAKMSAAQKKYLNGDSRQLPLGDLSKTEYRKCGLIATLKLRPDEPKKPKAEKKKEDKKSDKKEKKTKKSSKKSEKSDSKSDSKPEVEQPVAKKAKKTKVPKKDLQNVMQTLEEQKAVSLCHIFEV